MHTPGDTFPQNRSSTLIGDAGTTAPVGPADSTAVGRYLWGPRVAEGSAVEVYTGALMGAEAFRRPVLIKRLRPALAAERSQVKAFMEEARLAAQLNHAHIVQVLDVGRREGAPFIVFEAVDGPRLSDVNGLLSRTRVRVLSAPLAIFVVSQLLKALDYAHRHTDEQGRVGVVHRAVRPSTVLISRDGQVKLADFGLPMGPTALSDPASAAYVAPEVRAGGMPDARADLFSAGVVLYRTLTGYMPWDGQRLVPPTAHMPNLPISLERVILRALSPDPRDRFEDADGFLHHLLMSSMPHFPQATSRDLANWVDRLWKGPSAQASASDLNALVFDVPTPSEQRVAVPVTDRPTGEWSMGQLDEAPEPTWAGGAGQTPRGRSGAWPWVLVGAVLTASIGAAAMYLLT
ncbi:MAG: serine/threonine-protein kinase [Bradymonadia bacterium]